MDNETFDIKNTKYLDGKRTVYKMKVEITHRSEQVLRFNISAGAKIMVMEKIMLKKKPQWKISKTDFELKGDPREIAMTVMEIQDEIEFYLKGRPKPVSKYQK